MILSLLISAGIVAIAGMLLCALAFGHAVTIDIPLVAKFAGFVDVDGSPAAAITGSWAAVVVVIVVLASPLWAMAIFGWRRPR